MSGTFDHGGAPCPGCGESRWTLGPRIPSWPSLFSTGPARLIECEGCGTAHLPPVRLEDYETNAAVTVESPLTHRIKASKNLEDLHPLLREHLPKGSPRALVVGCSTGYEIEALLACPLPLTAVDGLEANESASDVAQSRFSNETRVTIHRGYLESLQSPYEFVSATMVLEHVPDPYSAVRTISRNQPEGGVLAVQVPRYDNVIPRVIRGRAWYYIMDAHLWYFSKRGLARMLERCGYDVIEVRNAPRHATLSFALDKIIRAALRHLGPVFTRGERASTDWDNLGRIADRIERRIERLSERTARSGFGLATKCFKMGFLNDAMTVFARRRPVDSEEP